MPKFKIKTSAMSHIPGCSIISVSSSESDVTSLDISDGDIIVV